MAARYFGITEQGNFVDHSHPQPLSGQNVLSVLGEPPGPGDAALLDSAREKMIRARSRRVRPHLDDKVLVSWNGLMLGAFARAGVTLSEPRYLQAAEKNLAFLKAKLWDESRRVLYHRWRDGERDEVQLLEAYGFLLSGVIDLYEATLEPDHLLYALTLAESMLRDFYDADRGGFWQAGSETADLILRLKEDYDGAQPSGNSVAILALLKLGAITERTDFLDAARRSLDAFGDRLREHPQAVPFLLQALDFAQAEPSRAVLSGPRGRDFDALLTAVHTLSTIRTRSCWDRGPCGSVRARIAGRPAAVVSLQRDSVPGSTADPAW